MKKQSNEMSWENLKFNKLILISLINLRIGVSVSLDDDCGAIDIVLAFIQCIDIMHIYHHQWSDTFRHSIPINAIILALIVTSIHVNFSISTNASKFGPFRPIGKTLYFLIKKNFLLSHMCSDVFFNNTEIEIIRCF